MSTHRAPLWILALALACGGAEEDPPNLLKDAYRVLAVEVSPPEARPEDQVTLRVHDYNPTAYDEARPEVAPFYVWSVCLYSLGAATQYDCADPMLERYFSTDGPELTLDLGPSGLNVRLILAALSQAIPPEVLEEFGIKPPSLEEGFDIFVRVYSGLEGEARRESVKRVRISEAAAPNQNPGVPRIIAEQTTVKPGGEVPLRLELAEGSVEMMQAGPETLQYSWYMTVGELERFRGSKDQLENTFMAPDEPGLARVFVFVRDQRGGVSSAHVDLIVAD
ncbi:hypothetical protein KKF91_08800 [Myxococcota bacterium]|nr:hypothetical protein [Myxococcota bacterium]